MPVRFERLTPGQALLSAKNENAIRETVEGLVNASGANVFVSPTGIHARDARKPGRPIFRYVVTGPEAVPDVVLAKRTDGFSSTGSDVPIRVYFQREIDEELYAFKPVGGTDAIYAGKPVDWLEMYTLGRGEFDGMTVITEGGQAVWGFPRAVAMPGL